MKQRSILLGTAVLVGAAACSTPAPDGEPWLPGGSDASDDADGDGMCSLSTDAAPLVLGGDAQAAPGRVSGLVVAGNATVACGAGFVAVAGGGGVEIHGVCTGLAAVDATMVAAVTDAGDVVLVSVQGTPAVVASAQAGGAAHDVAYDGATLAVALGTGGVAAFDVRDGSLNGLPSLSGLEVEALAATPDGWLVGGPGHITAVGANGQAGGTLSIRGSVHDIEVRDGLGLVARGAFGFDVVQLQGVGLTSLGTVPTEGSAVDGALLDGAALVATGAAIHRYTLAQDGAVLAARTPRPDESTLRGEWIAAMAVTDDQVDDRVVAAVGAEIRSVVLDDSVAGPVALLPRATTSLFGEGEREVVVLVRNGGNAELLVGALTVQGPLAVSSVDGAQARDGCPGQWSVPPGGSFLVTLAGSVSNAAADVQLQVATNDPGHAQLRLPVEVNRPSLAVGTPAPDFTLMSFGGDVVDLAAMRGEVVFLKLFSYA